MRRRAAVLFTPRQARESDPLVEYRGRGENVKGSTDFEVEMLGDSPEFQSVLRSARIVAATDVTLLIQGETGTGKELLARMVHSASRRASRPFTAVNCAALSDNLAESELFGHRKGSFTGAVSDYVGRIRACQGGTLFLDEVGLLPLSVQAKLLRFLESGECQSLGQPHAEHADVRVIAATNLDLRAQVQIAQFRADLYFRLNVVPLSLPALRDRKGDVPLLLESLLERLAEHHEVIAPELSSAALDRLCHYPWPGNVRELKNLCERLVIIMHGETIHPENLPIDIQSSGGSVGGSPFSFKLPDAGIVMDEIEAQFIRQALSRTGGNRSRAARLLGITRDTLLYRLKKYAIET